MSALPARPTTRPASQPTLTRPAARPALWIDDSAATADPARHGRAAADGPRHTRPDVTARPRLGFAGAGWIGLDRLRALAGSGVAHIAAIADPRAECRAAAARLAPRAHLCGGLDELLDAARRLRLDGAVIATPSALHAEQSIAALTRGLAVFCQKPLARTAAEARAVIDAARSAGRLLGVDLSYRYTEAARCVRELVRGGELGRVYAADLVFHNAYGPDKPWFYDRALAGGGCVMDLGIHLVDLALWLLSGPGESSGPRAGPRAEPRVRPRVVSVSGRLFRAGRLMTPHDPGIEDYAALHLDLDVPAAGRVAVRIACSWNLPAGRDAVIEATLFGTAGGAALRNVDGSFLDFLAERYRGRTTEALVAPPDSWGGRALIDWASRLAAGAGFDPAAEELIQVHEVLDAIYAHDPDGPGDSQVPRSRH